MPRHEELAGLGSLQRFGKQFDYLVYLRETLQHGHESAMLALGALDLDDIVVEIGALVARSHRPELGPRGVHQDRLQEADFAGDVEGGHGGEV